MKTVVVGVIITLAAMALYPIVVSVGQTVASKLREVHEELDETEQEDEDATN